MTDSTIIFICSLIAGFIAGMLWERWKYFKKTGNHLQDVGKGKVPEDFHSQFLRKHYE